MAALALIVAALVPMGPACAIDIFAGRIAQANEPAPGPEAASANFSQETAGNPLPPRATNQGEQDLSKLDLAKLQEWRKAQEAQILATKLRMDYFYWNTAMGVAIVTVFIVCFCVMHLFGRATGSFSRYFIVVTAIGTTIFLMVMGYTEAQVAPAFGLLGTILGYIFGKQAGETEAKAAQDGAHIAAAEGSTTGRAQNKTGAGARNEATTEDRHEATGEGQISKGADQAGGNAQ